MKEVTLHLPEHEAKILYSQLHRNGQDQDQLCETYRQLQGYFFQSLTIDEVTALLDPKE